MPARLHCAGCKLRALPRSSRSRLRLRPLLIEPLGAAACGYLFTLHIVEFGVGVFPLPRRPAGAMSLIGCTMRPGAAISMKL